jgi:hypothetical protein
MRGLHINLIERATQNNSQIFKIWFGPLQNQAQLSEK